MERREVHLDYREILRRLVIGDTSFLNDVRPEQPSNITASGLDPKTAALARLGASVAMITSPSGYQSHVDAAFAAGATVDEIVGVLIAVGPTVGLARLVMAAVTAWAGGGLRHRRRPGTPRPRVTNPVRPGCATSAAPYRGAATPSLRAAAQSPGTPSMRSSSEHPTASRTRQPGGSRRHPPAHTTRSSSTGLPAWARPTCFTP